MNRSAHDERWLEGGGEAGALVRSTDWSKTPLGPIASWPTSLKTTVATVLHSRHPMFLWWGPELIQIYNDGYIPSFGVGKHPAAMGQRGADCWQEIWPIISPQIDDVMQRGKASWNEDQLVPIFRNGRIEEVYWTYGYSPVFDESGNIAGTLVVCTETTARVLAERRRSEADRAKLALYEERNNLLMQAPMPTAVLRGPDHVFELANPPYCQMVGRTEIVGKKYVEAFPELADTALPGVLDEVYRTGKTFFSGEMLVSLDKGNGALEECFFNFTLEALRDPDGTIYGMMAVALEVTDQVNARRAIENAQQEREVLLGEAQKASRAKDEFFAMLGHELRNPLAPIVTALHLMKQHSTGVIPREQQIIERQVGHLVRLVDDLLDVSKIARGKVTLRKEIVELGAVVSTAIEIVSDLFEEHRHVLSIDVAANGLSVFGDPVRLAQVIANLLSNAARYTPPGGHISIIARRESDEVVLVVKDDGMGISAELLPHVFDLFVQGRRNTDRKEGGLGLGLALVQSLVSLHDGAVTARSSGAGRGSEFEIRLPAREKKAFREVAPNSKELKRVSPQKILIVDDNVDSAELMRIVLESAGHQVEVANDGPAALALVENFSPQIALLDIGLPVMDGYELGEKLHATPSAAACRLIALTGYGQEHDRAQSKASGFEAHFVKPVDTKALLELIATDKN